MNESSSTQLTLNVITENNIEDVINEINQAFFDIPFDNSTYQTEAFVISAQITPARAYRTIGLSINSKLSAVSNAKFERLREDIDIEELQSKIDDETTSVWDRRRFKLDIEQKLHNRPFADKLINDALTELNVLYSHFQALPRYTRKQFELQEQVHFEQKLNRQLVGLSGAKESLINMTDDARALYNFETDYINLPTPTQDQVDQLKLSNIIQF
jgi:hypothetical protein